MEQELCYFKNVAKYWQKETQRLQEEIMELKRQLADVEGHLAWANEDYIKKNN